jgi:hypothetical protein
MKKIPINNEPKEIVLSEDYIAFDEDDNMWDVWETKDLFTTGLTIGKIRFVLDNDDTVLSEALPLFGLNNGFSLESMKICDQWRRRLN